MARMWAGSPETTLEDQFYRRATQLGVRLWRLNCFMTMRNQTKYMLIRERGNRETVVLR